jgi:outer membrane protein assembly factor BamD (BamD/ComL family)
MDAMKSIYRHGDAAYYVVAQKPIQHFAKSFTEQPNMEYVQMYMKWLKCDHVLNNQTHFMFCETIHDAEIVDDDISDWDVTLMDGLEDDTH